mmetsp:Transcript_88199/g.159027  ORF Transcript_88199/g.159027 Transcript_88199/m.159027 type:complete len:242 (+) Transcript_88199:472-1197(+)
MTVTEVPIVILQRLERGKKEGVGKEALVVEVPALQEERVVKRQERAVDELEVKLVLRRWVVHTCSGQDEQFRLHRQLLPLCFSSQVEFLEAFVAPIVLQAGFGSAVIQELQHASPPLRPPEEISQVRDVLLGGDAAEMDSRHRERVVEAKAIFVLEPHRDPERELALSDAQHEAEEDVVGVGDTYLAEAAPAAVATLLGVGAGLFAVSAHLDLVQQHLQNLGLFSEVIAELLDAIPFRIWH